MFRNGPGSAKIIYDCIIRNIFYRKNVQKMYTAGTKNVYWNIS